MSLSFIFQKKIIYKIRHTQRLVQKIKYSQIIIVNIVVNDFPASFVYVIVFARTQKSNTEQNKNKIYEICLLWFLLAFTFNNTI